MKRYLLIISFLMIPFIYAETSSSSINWASLRYVEENYCMINGDCILHSLNVTGNITATNITVTNINLTGNFDNRPYNIYTNRINASKGNFSNYVDTAMLRTNFWHSLGDTDPIMSYEADKIIVEKPVVFNGGDVTGGNADFDAYYIDGSLYTTYLYTVTNDACWVFEGAAGNSKICHDDDGSIVYYSAVGFNDFNGEVDAELILRSGVETNSDLYCNTAGASCWVWGDPVEMNSDLSTNGQNIITNGGDKYCLGGALACHSDLEGIKYHVYLKDNEVGSMFHVEMDTNVTNDLFVKEDTIMEDTLRVDGLTNLSQTIIKGGADDALKIYEGAASKGIIIYSQDGDWTKFNNDGTYGAFDSNYGFRFKQNGANMVFVYNSLGHGFRLYNKVPMSFGSTGSISYHMYYDQDTNRFKFTKNDAQDNIFYVDDDTMNLSIDKNTTINANLNVNKNITGNQIYSRMAKQNDTGDSLIFGAQNVYYNFTFINVLANGFDFDGTSKLVAVMDGAYQVQYQASGSGQANHVYKCTVGIGGQEKNSTASYMRVSNVNDVTTLSGGGIIGHISKGDVITLMIKDLTGSGAGTRYSSQINLIRIGD